MHNTIFFALTKSNSLKHDKIVQMFTKRVFDATKPQVIHNTQ